MDDEVSQGLDREKALSSVRQALNSLTKGVAELEALEPPSSGKTLEQSRLDQVLDLYRDAQQALALIGNYGYRDDGIDFLSLRTKIEDLQTRLAFFANQWLVSRDKLEVANTTDTALTPFQDKEKSFGRPGSGGDVGDGSMGENGDDSGGGAASPEDDDDGDGDGEREAPSEEDEEDPMLQAQRFFNSAQELYGEAYRLGRENWDNRREELRGVIRDIGRQARVLSASISVVRTRILLSGFRDKEVDRVFDEAEKLAKLVGKELEALRNEIARQDAIEQERQEAERRRRREDKPFADDEDEDEGVKEEGPQKRTAEQQRLWEMYAQGVRDLNGSIDARVRALRVERGREDWNQDNLDELRALINDAIGQQQVFDQAIEYLREQIIFNDILTADDRSILRDRLVEVRRTLESMDQHLRALEQIRDRIVADMQAADGGEAQRVAEYQTEVDLFNELIGQIVAQRWYTIHEDNDPFDAVVSRAQDLLADMRRKGAPLEVYQPLEREFLRVRFVTNKANVLQNIIRRENNEDSASALDGYNNTILSRILEDMATIVRLIPENDPAHARYQAEYVRFKKEYGHIITFYMAAKSLRNSALGIAADGESRTAMTLPTSLPVFFNSLTNKMLGNLVHPNALPPCEFDELRGHEEVEPQVNKVIGERVVRALNPVTGQYEEQVMEMTAWGQTLRYLDKLFQGRGGADFNDFRRDVAGLSQGKLYEIITDLETKRLRQVYERDRAEAQQRIDDGHNVELPDPEGAKYKSQLSEQEVRRAFNYFILHYGHIIEAPSSFNEPSPAYYATNLDYLMGEVLKRTGGNTVLLPFGLFGLANPEFDPEEFPDLVPYVLDFLKSDEKIKNVLIRLLIGKARVSDVRKKIKRAFERGLRKGIRGRFKGKRRISEKYSFLHDLPLLVIIPKGTHPTLKDGKYAGEQWWGQTSILPWTNYLVRNPNDPKGEPYHTPDETGSFTNPDAHEMTFHDFVDMISVAEADAILEGAVLTDDDSDEDTIENARRASERAEAHFEATGLYPDPNGDRLYELLPFTDAVESEVLKWWVNQAKNIVDFYTDILNLTPSKLAAMEERELINAIEKKNYYFLSVSEPHGHYNRRNPQHFEAQKQKMILTFIFIQGIYMLSEGKTMTDVKRKFNTYRVTDREGIEAIQAALIAGFGTTAMAQAFAEGMAKQIVDSLQDRGGG